jgi:hypothetical protein
MSAIGPAMVRTIDADHPSLAVRTGLTARTIEEWLATLGC